PLEITARLSKSGDAVAAKGDVEGVAKGVAVGATDVRIALDTVHEEGAALLRQRAHPVDERSLPLAAGARELGQEDGAVRDAHAVRKASEGLEQVRIVLVAAQAEAGRDVERHLVAAVRDAAAARPSRRLDHGQRPLVLAQAVRERAVELE